RRYLVHFTPFVVSWIYMGAFVLTHDEQRIVHLFDESLFLGQPLWFQFFTILEGAIFPAYVVLTYLLIRRHRKGIANLFSYRETVDLTWLYHLVVGVGASLVLYGAADLWGRWSGWYAWEEGLLLGAALSTFCTIYVGYFGLRQQAIYATPSSGAVSLAGAKSQLAGPASPPVDVSEPVKYRHSSLSAADGQQYARHLLALMESERSYLNSKLSLQELAGLLGLSTHQVSQVINQEFGESFYDFVNRHRMEAFKRAIAEGRHRRFTLLSIAYDCGFNSKASFNRVFKKFTGRTPTQYVRAVEASPETS
ncbi:MAG: helix-turn-helix domain-containing protein, partial [Rhodothermales bacterium]